MKRSTPTPRPLGRHALRQRGMSLLFALLALVALSLAAVGLVRSVGGASLAVGNLAFKLDATTSADRGAEQAIAWLQANSAGATLEANAAASGYYATSTDALDATGRNTAAATRAVVDWGGDNCATVGGSFTACLAPSSATTIGGNSVSWIITRLCATAGSATAVGNSCATALNAGTAEDAKSGAQDNNDQELIPAEVINPYYRIVVRTVGGRNAVSFTETIMHF